jgi:hypothetical protein
MLKAELELPLILVSEANLLQPRHSVTTIVCHWVHCF